MARQTRAQRRARREAQSASAAAAGAGGASLPAAAAPPIGPPSRRQVALGGADEPRRERGGIRGTRFIRESWAELRKVEWPSQNQVIQGTVVVMIACVIVGFYLYASDQAFKRLVENVFLR